MIWIKASALPTWETYLASLSPSLRFLIYKIGVIVVSTTVLEWMLESGAYAGVTSIFHLSVIQYN